MQPIGSPPLPNTLTARPPARLVLPQEDKKCNVAKPFKTGLPTGEGSFKWTPGELARVLSWRAR